MQITLYRAESRGRADFGWLKTRYNFSFANYYDPSRMHFGALRVFNDDWIAGGGGFDTHPHDNMEIVTVMLEGELRHSDSMGHTEVLKPGEVQAMTAGAGIFHSEHNNLEDSPAQLFQIWIYPREKGLTPSYDQRFFDPALRRNTWQTLASPAGEESLRINQDAWLSRASLTAGESLGYSLHHRDMGAFLMVVEGSVSVGEAVLDRRDGAGFRQVDRLEVTALEEADVLLIEIPA